MNAAIALADHPGEDTILHMHRALLERSNRKSWATGAPSRFGSPFPDGNGRTGRALIHAHLRRTGVTRHVTVPISAGLLTSIDDYFKALEDFRR